MNDIFVTIGYLPILIIPIFLMLIFNFIIIFPYFYFYNFIQIIMNTEKLKQ